MLDDRQSSVLERTHTSQRVVTLRERLLRADISVSYLQPADVNHPALFDDHVDAAVREFQQSRGLIVDGRVGAQTEKALNEAQFKLGDRSLVHAHNGTAPMRGEDVAQLQRQLSHLGFFYGHIDGEYGQATAEAVSDLQHNVGLPSTGICDESLIAALSRIKRPFSSSTAYSLRELERLTAANAALVGTSILLQPATWIEGPSAGNHEHGVKERAITLDVAQRSARILTRLGAQVVLPNGADNKPTEAHRVSDLPHGRASIAINLRCDWLSSPSAGGISAFYWGLHETDETKSPVGHRLARVLQHELVARTGAVDLGIHPRSWHSLRNISPATVQVDLGYLGNPDDASRLADESSRQLISEALVIGIQRLFMVEDDDPETGTMDVEDVHNLNSIPTRQPISVD
ncbi:N-acetylmuramoyl-L-alanine amidase [Arthrobacter pigmenti]